MNKIDCVWELQNIGEKTYEFNVENTDVFCPSIFENLSCKYIVVKVPAGKVEYSLELQKNGFAQIESQFEISKQYTTFDFDNPLVRSLNKKTSFNVIDSADDLNEILDQMTPMMFTTDRISLDPYFGPEYGLRRYLNWIRTEFESGKSAILGIYNRGILVGFSMFRVKEEKCYVLLGGLFEKYQNYGLGLLTAISPVLYAYQNALCYKSFETSISSNNFPVIEFYNYLNYKIDRIVNVFIKHI